MAEARVLLAGNVKSWPANFTELLNSSGYEVIACESVIDAIREVNMRGANLLITTAQLREFSGHQLCCLIKSDISTASLPVIFIDDGEGKRLRLAGLPNLSDVTISKAEAEKDIQNCLKIISEQILKGRQKGWSGSPSPLSLDFGIFQADPAQFVPTLLDSLLIDRLVAGKVRELLEKMEPHNTFVESFFHVVQSLGRFDFVGIAIASPQNSWAAFTGGDGLNQTQFDLLLQEIKAKLSPTQEMTVETHLKLSPNKDLMFGDKKLVTVTLGKTEVGILVVAKFGNNKLAPGEHALIDSFKTNLQPLVKLLMTIQEVEALRMREAYFASVDPLTGLYNLEFLIGFLQQQLSFSYRQKLAVTVLLMDIDTFARLGNAHGWNMGDTVLQKIANRLLSSTRASDLLARYGTDEFAIVLPNTDLSGAKVVAEKLRLEIEQMTFLEGEPERSPHVTVSIGCAQFDMSDLNPETILQDAKLALQQAKQSGRNRVCP